MRLSDFDYNLPQELIAQYPLEKRDEARLLVLNRAEQSIEHRIFKDITDYLLKGDLLVVNNTKVLASRIVGRRVTGGRVEFLLLRRKEGLTFDTLIKPGRIKIGEKVLFNSGKISGMVSGKGEITFCAPTVQAVYGLGVMPLPPYIKREPVSADSIYYQTIYAEKEGAVASPTAGLHFTRELLSSITLRGVNTAYLTLHVGYGTFKPVKIDNITEHKMEEEYFKIDDEAARLIEAARKGKGRVIAVGTTSCRSLESYADGMREGYTDLFICPGYNFKITDCLLTNFHLPRTTLFMLVCAFAGEKFIKEAYRQAIDKKYRFYSYGDAMLVL